MNSKIDLIFYQLKEKDINYDFMFFFKNKNKNNQREKNIIKINYYGWMFRQRKGKEANT